MGCRRTKLRRPDAYDLVVEHGVKAAAEDGEHAAFRMRIQHRARRATGDGDLDRFTPG